MREDFTHQVDECSEGMVTCASALPHEVGQ